LYFVFTTFTLIKWDKQCEGKKGTPLSSCKPPTPSTILQHSALQNIAEFSTLVLEGREPFLGKRIEIASDGKTGEQAAKILSNILGYKIKYVPIPLEQVYRANEDMARMYEWYEKVGTGLFSCSYYITMRHDDARIIIEL
jgi:hypothetical protein